MPTVLRVGPYRFHFYSDESREPGSLNLAKTTKDNPRHRNAHLPTGPTSVLSLFGAGPVFGVHLNRRLSKSSHPDP
jgi:hypothetical protein